MAKANDVRPGAPVGRRCDLAGYTAISSAMGRVASSLAPCTTIPASVSLTTDRAMSVLSCRIVSVGTRLRCRLTRVWVRTRSSSRTFS